MATDEKNPATFISTTKKADKRNILPRSFSLGVNLIAKRKQVTCAWTNRDISGELTESSANELTDKSIRIVLSRNKITQISDGFFQHKHLTLLRVLDLSHNKISVIPNCISVLKDLRDLDLSHNSFRTFPEECIGLPSLKKLDLSHNLITTLPNSIPQFPAITKIIIQDNKIHTLPQSVCECRTLRQLSMRNNPLLQPPGYIVERGIADIRKYLSVIEKENNQKLFEFRFVLPFVTGLTVSSEANALYTYEDTHIYTNDEIKKWRKAQNSNYAYSLQIATKMDVGKRNYAEDRVDAKSWEPFPEILPGFKAVYVAVYDGHGGTNAVELVVKHLRKIVLQLWRTELFTTLKLDCDNLKNCPVYTPGEKRDKVENSACIILPGVLKRAFAATQGLLEKAWEENSLNDGTTAVVNILVYNKLFSAHCGDSRGVVIRGGRALAYTKDHKPNDPKERERIEFMGGTVKKVGNIYRVDSVLSVSRTLGDCDFKVSTLPLTTFFWNDLS